MPSFGKKSKDKLSRVHPLLVSVLKEAILHLDFTIVKGWRGMAEQNALYPKYTRLRYPHSKHNNTATRHDVQYGWAEKEGDPLSLAVDVAPWHRQPPNIRWNQIEEFYLLSGFIRGLSFGILPLRYRLRVGTDWDGDGYIIDQDFHDLGHIELVDIHADA